MEVWQERGLGVLRGSAYESGRSNPREDCNGEENMSEKGMMTQQSALIQNPRSVKELFLRYMLCEHDLPATVMLYSTLKLYHDISLSPEEFQ